MAPGWEIREATRDDLPGLEQVWRTLHAHHSRVSTATVPFISADERWPERLAEFELAFDEGVGLALIAASAGGPVGFAFSTMHGPDKIFASGPVGEIDVLVVAPERRGEGIGEELVRRSLELLRERGAGTVRVVVVAGNDAALRFYHRLGIEPALVELLAPLPPGESRRGRD